MTLTIALPSKSRMKDVAVARLAAAGIEVLPTVDSRASCSRCGGTHTATVWTCDLSAEYVKINAEYRT